MYSFLFLVGRAPNPLDKAYIISFCVCSGHPQILPIPLPLVPFMTDGQATNPTRQSNASPQRPYGRWNSPANIYSLNLLLVGAPNPPDNNCIITSICMLGRCTKPPEHTHITHFNLFGRSPNLHYKYSHIP